MGSPFRIIHPAVLAGPAGCGRAEQRAILTACRANERPGPIMGRIAGRRPDGRATRAEPQRAFLTCRHGGLPAQRRPGARRAGAWSDTITGCMLP
jgi:hypothetical protein